MQHIRAIRILMRLSPTEQKEFFRYIDSSFFNRSELQKKLVAELLRQLRKTGEPPEREQLFRRLYPDLKTELKALPPESVKKFVGKRLDPLLHDLKQHLENYLAWKMSSSPSMTRDFDLTRNLLDRGLPDLAEAHSRKAQQRLQETDRFDAGFHLYMYLHSSQRYAIASQQNQSPDPADLLQGLAHLDHYYLTQKFNHAYVLRIHEFVNNVASEIPLLDSLLKEMEEIHLAPDLYLQVYTALLRNLQTEGFTLSEFEKFKALILSQIEAVPPRQRYGLFKILTNYLGILMVLRKSSQADRAYFNIYDLALEKGYLMEQGALTFETLYQYVVVASKVGETVQATARLQELQGHIKADYRESAFRTCMAFVCFAEGRFRDCLRELSAKTKAADRMDRFKEKQLRLNSYLELNEFELFEATMEAVRKQLERAQNLGPLYLEKMRDYLRVLQGLYQGKLAGKFSPELLAEIEAHPTEPFQAWLLAKAVEFRGGA